MGAVIGIEVRAVDRAAWEAAKSSFEKNLGNRAGRRPTAAAGDSKAPPPAPADERAGAPPANPAPGWRGVP